MKIVHLSDLHLGKKVNGFSMIEDQKYILNEILNVIKNQKSQVVIIAGDIYDKPVPTREAVQLFDKFLVELSNLSQKVLVISGNHDSAERMAFGRRLMENKGVYMAPVYDGHVEPVVLSDEYGEINFYMLPFIKPVNVRGCFPEENIETYTDAVKCAVEHMGIDKKKRNVIIAHQFVGGADRCDSEEISVGGIDNVVPGVFEAFDYTALGHIHGPQNAGSDKIRYSGTPLKYSFSEKNHKKSITVVEMFEKGNQKVTTVPLTAKRDLREIKGTYNQLTLKSFYENQNTDDYLRVILTDEDDVPDALAKLRVIYPNIMKLDYENTRTRSITEITFDDDFEKRSEIELLEDFYKMQNGMEMSETQRDFAIKIFEEIKNEDV